MEGIINGVLNKQEELRSVDLELEVKRRSDKLINYFLAGFFALGLLLAFFHQTWAVAFGIGGLSVLTYYLVKFAIPYSNLYQYILAAVLGIFTVQFIYQVGELFEIDFIAFIASALLITYQNWKLQLPLMIVVGLHYAVFGFFQSHEYNPVFFTQLNYLEVNSFQIHLALAAIIFFICGMLSYQLQKHSEIQIEQISELIKLQNQKLHSIDQKHIEECFEKSNNRYGSNHQDGIVCDISPDLAQLVPQITEALDFPEIVTEGQLPLRDLGMQKTHVANPDTLTYGSVNYSADIMKETIKEKVNFIEILDEIMSSLRYLNGTKQVVEFNVNIRQDVPFVSDRQVLHKILNNVILIAVQNQSQTASKPFVYIKVHCQPSKVVIVIRDNGSGVKTDFIEKKSGTMSPDAKHQAGPYLSLSTLKEAIDKLHGQIQIESEMPFGTEFNIHLPNHCQSYSQEKMLC